MSPATIQRAESDDQILATFDVIHQLRPHLVREDYVATVRRMMQSDGYHLAYVLDGNEVRAVAGYRFMEMLYCGRLLYIDDLVTDERARSGGFGKELLDWLKAEARDHRCREVQLISGVHRDRAHRFYFREGMTIQCFHFATDVLR
jgi:GNAT superfamily N-acetyltransferase